MPAILTPDPGGSSWRWARWSSWPACRCWQPARARRCTERESMGSFRLSPQQRRLWQLGADDPAYRAQCAVRLSGPAAPERLRSALERTVERHEILRTVFQGSGLKFPLQVVTPGLKPCWRELSVRRPIEDLLQE